MANCVITVDAEGSHNRSYARTGHWDGMNRPNYDLLTNSKVVRIELDGNRTTGVSFVPRNSTSKETPPVTIKVNREVIVSAGTVHSPQVLQLSGIGPRTLLESAGIQPKIDLPGVGQNFHDHNGLDYVIKCK